MSDLSQPAAGLPDHLPQGERLLWQGRPDWRLLARDVMHVRKVAVYFAALLAWYVASSLQDGRNTLDVAVSVVQFGALALVALGLLAGYAWLTSRATIYSVTSRRVVLRFGIALPMTVNLPFRQVEAANVKQIPGGGEIALSVASTGKLGYLVLWPNVRRWHFAKPEPTLRGLRDAAKVAQVLSRALAADASTPVAVMPESQAPVAASRNGRRAAAAA